MLGRNTARLKTVAEAEMQGIRVDVIGDSGPFSEIGKSIGYRISYRGNKYLLDCGAPLFQQ